MLNMEFRYRWLPEMLVTDHGMCTASNSSAEAKMLKFLVLCVENVCDIMRWMHTILEGVHCTLGVGGLASQQLEATFLTDSC